MRQHQGKQNLTITLMIVWLAVISLLPIQAQTLPQIEANNPQTLPLTADNPIFVQYTADEPQWVTIRAIGDNMDTTLTLIDPNGDVIVYQDDRPVIDAEPIRNAEKNTWLPEAGTYTIRVDSFNGVSEGDVRVSVREFDAYEIETDYQDPEVNHTWANLTPSSGLTLFFGGREGNVYRVTVRDLTGNLDPILRVYDETGELVVFNDDHESDDLTLNTFDAQVEFTLLADRGDTYKFHITDWLGRTGRVQVSHSVID